MTDKSKTLSEGDQVIFKLSQGSWTVHVKYATGGISGRLKPLPSFDAALATLKEDYSL